MKTEGERPALSAPLPLCGFLCVSVSLPYFFAASTIALMRALTVGT